ncbi:MAG: tetratricopeptide repeat protein, partial [Chloroflexota bacterium]
SGVSALYGALVEPLSALYRHEDALTAAWRSLELARSVGDERILVEATVRYGLALFGMGLLHEARATLEEGLAGEEKLDLGGPLSRSLCLLGAIAMAQGRTTDAHVYLTASMTIADERADVAAIVAVEERLGSLAFVLGNWDDALFHRKHAVDLVQSISFAHFSAMTLLALGEQYLLQGDTDSASRYLEEPFTLAERSGQTVQLPRLEIPLAANDRREGNPRRALQRLEPLIDRPAFETAPDHEPMLVAAEAYLEIGDEQRAEEIIEQGLTFARDQEHRLVIVEWLQLKSILAERRGRRPQAIALLDDALTLARAIPYPYQEALTLHRLGMLTGELDHLIAARDIFQRLGARPFAGRVEDLEMWHSYADNKSTSELSPTVEATMENETTPR